MQTTNLKSLIGKLNKTCRTSLESAAGLCLSQTHYEVDLEHFFVKLLETENTDFQKILRHFEINETRLSSDLTRTTHVAPVNHIQCIVCNLINSIVDHCQRQVSLPTCRVDMEMISVRGRTVIRKPPAPYMLYMCVFAL